MAPVEESRGGDDSLSAGGLVGGSAHLVNAPMAVGGNTLDKLSGNYRSQRHVRILFYPTGNCQQKESN